MMRSHEEVLMRSLPSLGDLKQAPNIPDDWISKPIPVPFCSGKELRFAVRTAADDSGDPPDVEQAVRNFLALTADDQLKASVEVYRRYHDLVKSFPEVDVGIKEPAEVWNYLRPEGISVDRYDEGDGQVYVRVVYQCDWEAEHGQQILFRHGTTITLVGEHEDGSFVEPEPGSHSDHSTQ
jgi:hypothetical protein